MVYTNIARQFLNRCCQVKRCMDGSRLVAFTTTSSLIRFFGFPKLLVGCSSGALLSLALFKSSTDKETKSHKALIQKADELWASYSLVPLYELLANYKDSDDPEILWRFARCILERSKQPVLASSIKSIFINDAYRLMKHALEGEGGQNSAQVHKWYAIALSLLCRDKGANVRIQKAYEVREHLQKAAELQPSDPEAWHLLGWWSYRLLDISWFQAKVANILYTKPPSTSYDEALEYLLKADALRPNFCCETLYLIGSIYLRLGDKQRAKEYLQQAATYVNVVARDDINAQLQAKARLELEFSQQSKKS